MADPARLDEPVVALRDQLHAYARDLRTVLAENRSAREELARTHVETVAALAAAVDVRDEVTGGHVYRVANYGLLLAEHMAPALAADPQLVYGFLLHDIGKLGVPDRVLLKEGPLDPHERELMQTHVGHGVRFVEHVSFLRPALRVVATHHEAWDGSGYPRGLKGEQIPLVTRLFGVCDAFDAMIHDRPYRTAMPPEAALTELRRGAGGQFDPAVVAAFEEVADRLVAVPDRPPVPGVASSAFPSPRGPHQGALDLAFDAVDDGLLLVNSEGVVTDVNVAFLELFGLARPPIGLRLDELATILAGRLADPARAPQNLGVVPEPFGHRSEAVFEVASPAPRVVRRIFQGLYGESGRDAGSLLVFRDVSEEHRCGVRAEVAHQQTLSAIRSTVARLRRIADGTVTGTEAARTASDCLALLAGATIDLDA